MIKWLDRWFEQRVDPYPKKLDIIQNRRFLSFLYACTQGVRFWLWLLIICTALFSLFEAYLFQIVSEVVNWLTQADRATIWQEKKNDLLFMAAIVAGGLVVFYLKSTIRYQTIIGVFAMRLRWKFHLLLLEQSYYFYQNEFAGRISTKVMQTALAVREVVMVFIDIVVYFLVYFLGISVVLLQFDWWLMTPFALWLFLYGVMMYYFVPKLSFLSQTQADARSLMTGRITDAYTNITTVKLFAQSAQEADYAKEAMDEFLVTVHWQMRVVKNLRFCNQLLNISFLLAVILLGMQLWQLSAVNAGALAAALAMALRLSNMSESLMWQMANLFENVGVVKDGISTFTKRLSVKDSTQAKPLQVTAGTIDFSGVYFCYQTKPLFENFNLSIGAGEKIGLVGRSGSGKTTLVNLLLRLYDVDRGTIRIDGQNIAAVTQQSLRAQVGVVSQDTSLLHRTIRENIMYGRPDASEQEMLQAAKKALADEFIVDLQDKYGNTGYDVHVGERGLKLSGGQRQRIAIARVILKNAPILVLDEATSALDSEVEAAIQSSLGILMANKTVIAIAHRLSTIALMDRLIVLDKGRIVEAGTHNQLLAQDGVYAKLWRRQSGGFIAVSTDD